MPQTHRMPQSLRMRLRTPVRMKLRTRRQHPPRPSRRRTCNCTRNRTHTHTRSHNRIHTHSRNRIHSRGSPGRGLRHEHRAATWWSRRLPEQNLPSFASLFSFRVVLSPTQKQIDLSASNFSPKREEVFALSNPLCAPQGVPAGHGPPVFRWKTRTHHQKGARLVDARAGAGQDGVGREKNHRQRGASIMGQGLLGIQYREDRRGRETTGFGTLSFSGILHWTIPRIEIYCSGR